MQPQLWAMFRKCSQPFGGVNKNLPVFWDHTALTNRLFLFSVYCFPFCFLRLHYFDKSFLSFLSLAPPVSSLNAFVAFGKCNWFPYLIQDPPTPGKTAHCEVEQKKGLQSPLHSDQIELCWPFGYCARVLGAIWTDYYRGGLFAVNLHKKANWRRSEIEQWAPYWWHHLPASLHLTSYVLHMSASYISHLSAFSTYYIFHLISYICQPQFILHATHV